jgi:hypothetical protein
MDEKLKLIASFLEVEKMNSLCREFGISRKTDQELWGRRTSPLQTWLNIHGVYSIHRISPGSIF